MHSETIVAIFPTEEVADRAAAELADIIPSAAIRRAAKSEVYTGDIVPLGTHAHPTSDVFEWLTGGRRHVHGGHDSADGRFVGPGRVVVTASVGEPHAEHVFALFDRHRPIQLGSLCQGQIGAGAPPFGRGAEDDASHPTIPATRVNQPLST